MSDNTEKKTLRTVEGRVVSNKMDKTGADFYRCLEMIESRLGAVGVAIQLPIGAESDFKGVVDLIEMNALVWRDETLGAQWDIVEIPADLKDKAEQYREKMIEAAVEMDEAALEAYLDGNLPSNDELRRLIRKGTIEVKFHPVLCGTAFKNKGVQPLLDAVSTSCRPRSKFPTSRASTRRPMPRSSASRPTTSRFRCSRSRS